MMQMKELRTNYTQVAVILEENNQFTKNSPHYMLSLLYCKHTILSYQYYIQFENIALEMDPADLFHN